MTQYIAVTAGEPAGIGPDILLMAAMQPQPTPLLAIADRELLATRARVLNLDINLVDAPVTGTAARPLPPHTLASGTAPCERLRTLARSTQAMRPMFWRPWI